jgi:hypothetical protein
VVELALAKSSVISCISSYLGTHAPQHLAPSPNRRERLYRFTRLVYHPTPLAIQFLIALVVK